MEYLSVKTLALDLCSGFENEINYNYNDVVQRIEDLLDSGLYTIEELWEINNEDSTKMYDLIF
jgi:hypothetical protein